MPLAKWGPLGSENEIKPYKGAFFLIPSQNDLQDHITRLTTQLRTTHGFHNAEVTPQWVLRFGLDKLHVEMQEESASRSILHLGTLRSNDKEDLRGMAVAVDLRQLEAEKQAGIRTFAMLTAFPRWRKSLFYPRLVFHGYTQTINIGKLDSRIDRYQDASAGRPMAGDMLSLGEVVHELKHHPM